MRYLVVFILLFQLAFSAENKKDNILGITDASKNKYIKKYGKRAVIRLNYLSKLVDDLQVKTNLQKIYETNKIVNKVLHYATDQRLWNKNNYWADPLESIGMGYGDTEDIALLKMLILIKLGLPYKNMKLVQKDIELVDIKDNRSKENIALAYYDRGLKKPIILDHKLQKGKRIYRLNTQYGIKTVKNIQSKLWQGFFSSNASKTFLNKILNEVKE